MTCDSVNKLLPLPSSKQIILQLPIRFEGILGETEFKMEFSECICIVEKGSKFTAGKFILFLLNKNCEVQFIY